MSAARQTFLAIILTALIAARPRMQAASPQTAATSVVDPVALVARAAGLLQRGNAAEAEPLLREALRLDSRSSLAHTYLGQVLLAQGRAASAMDEFEAVLAYEPSDEAARSGERTAAERAAVQLRNEGKNELALFALQHALNLLPDDVSLLTDLGVQAQAMHRLGLANKTLNHVLELQPGEPRALYALARTELDQEHFADAERHLRAYVETHPDDASAHYGLGHLYQMQLKTEAARSEFKRSTVLQPVQTESYYQLGQIDLEAGDEEQARTQFDVVLQRLPTHGGALTGLGILDYRAHRYETAKASLEKAIAASPEYQPAYYYLGLTLKRLGQTTASEIALKHAADLAAQQQGKGQPILQTPGGEP